MEVAGDAKNNKIWVVGCALMKASGGKGNDRLFADLPRFVDGCKSPRVRLDGLKGDDELNGSSRDDVLVGGSGRDVARGNKGKDLCSAEKRLGCES